MWSRLICVAAATALATGVAVAQDASRNDDLLQAMPQKIRDKLTAQGFKDVKVTPGSYVVSARDQDGQRVVIVIGPTETTMMKLPDANPSQAQTPNKDGDQIIQQ
ncbi:MAG TPA: PepSY domain-containing protein [Reyranella sp.]|nr:PepSY domain-containing protein [Reyranella sp.]